MSAELTPGISRLGTVLTSGNPAWTSLLGLCPLLAVSTSVVNALTLAVATTGVLLGSSIAIATLRHRIPEFARLPAFVLIIATWTTCAVMLLEAFLSFLGLGVQPPMSSWGVLIKDGAEKMEEFSWLLVFPAALFSLTLFSLNFLGDGLRDALDVRSSKD